MKEEEWCGERDKGVRKMKRRRRDGRGEWRKWKGKRQSRKRKMRR